MKHDEKAQKTIERLEDASAYMVVAIFGGGNIEIANRSGMEQNLLMLKVADLHISNGFKMEFSQNEKQRNN